MATTMKEVYLAYFDFMGFKEFIQNNEDETLMRRMGHIFRDIEICLGQGKYQEPNKGVILADVSRSKLNCLNISDTVIVWTNECDLDSLKELINVAYEFNWREIGYNFPLRGTILKGKIKEVTGRQVNSEGGSYSVQCVYGKGIVDAHLKAEAQNWAGTVIDQSIIDDLLNFEQIDFINKITTRYEVPYKTGNTEEYVFKIKKTPLNDTALTNILRDIERIFSMDNKSIEDESVKLKIENTKKFIIDTKDEE
jgi:hypothetical protein